MDSTVCVLEPVAFSEQSSVELHHLPFSSSESHDANVRSYLLTEADSTKSNDLTDVSRTSFRGRILKGGKLSLPEDYTGIVYVNASSENEPDVLQPQSSFSDFYMWNQEVVPDETAPLIQLRKWISFSSHLHSES
eukprot:GCRY01002013.1.p1 GENE.GCRY01002013.1~~GCRY01002013.1.p1  ORF type:complete len:135 (+),score=11.19 GCRY01002013.1:236-640(+)